MAPCTQLVSLREFASWQTSGGTACNWRCDQGPMSPPLRPASWVQAEPQAGAAAAVRQRSFAAGSSNSASNGGAQGQTPLSRDKSSAEFEKQVLYRGRGIRLFRVLVRLKVFQLTGVAALAVPITTFLSSGQVSGMQAVIAASLLIGSGAASTALWFYSRRYVGELSLLRPRRLPGSTGQTAAAAQAATAGQQGSMRPGAEEREPQQRPEQRQPGRQQEQQQQEQQHTHVRLSVLDFWGRREDNDVPLEHFVPPLAGLPPGARRVMAAEPLMPVDVEGDRQYYLSVRYGHLVDAPTLQQLLAGEMPEQQALAAAADQHVAAAVAAEGSERRGLGSAQ